MQEHPARQIAGYCDPDQWQCSCWTFIGTDELRAPRMKKCRINVIPCPGLFPGPFEAPINYVQRVEATRPFFFFSFPFSFFFFSSSYLLCPPYSFCFRSFRYVTFVLSRYLFSEFSTPFSSIRVAFPLPSFRTATNHFSNRVFPLESEKLNSVESAVNLLTAKVFG